MSAINYNDLQGHIGHDIECVSYGKNNENIAIECINCGEVIMDFDKEEEYTSDVKRRFNDLLLELENAELTQTNYFYLKDCIKQCQ